VSDFIRFFYKKGKDNIKKEEEEKNIEKEEEKEEGEKT